MWRLTVSHAIWTAPFVLAIIVTYGNADVVIIKWLIILCVFHLVAIVIDRTE